MANNTFEACELTRIQDATAVGNTVTETIIVPDYSFGANYFTQGKTIRVNLWGVISNVVTAVPTITLRVRIGPLTLSTIAVFASGALVTNATANTNLTWHGEFLLVCRSAGTAGTIFCAGQVWLPNLTSATTVNTVGYPNLIPASAPAAGTLDTTVTNLLGVSAQWSAANASNTITVNQHTLESLN